MLVAFAEKYLEELYLIGKCSDKKHRLQPRIIYSYQEKIQALRSAETEEDLFILNSLCYKKLSGDKKGISSIRINNQYRLEFKISTKYDETIVTICTILDISNHYR